MAVDRKPVTIHYRKFSRAATVQHTLEELVRRAMNTAVDGNVPIRNRYLARLLSVGSDNYFINTYSDGAGTTPLVFGDILHFTKGHLQALCQTADQDAASVPVQQMKAPEQSEYVHSQMFWMVKDDHAFVVQSMSLRTAEFEQYLDWLLKTCTTNLGAEHLIILEAKFDEDEVGGDLSDIQEIIVGGVAAPTPTVPDNEIVEQVREVDLFFQACEKLGCHVVLDDFTFHHNTTRWLGSAALKFLKLDARITAVAMKERVPQAMVVAIAQASKVLGLSCVAKRVDTPAVREWLSAVGLDYAQGFLLDQPKPLLSLAATSR